MINLVRSLPAAPSPSTGSTSEMKIRNLVITTEFVSGGYPAVFGGGFESFGDTVVLTSRWRINATGSESKSAVYKIKLIELR